MDKRRFHFLLRMFKNQHRSALSQPPEAARMIVQQIPVLLGYRRTSRGNFWISSSGPFDSRFLALTSYRRSVARTVAPLARSTERLLLKCSIPMHVESGRITMIFVQADVLARQTVSRAIFLTAFRSIRTSHLLATKSLSQATN